MGLLLTIRFIHSESSESPDKGQCILGDGAEAAAGGQCRQGQHPVISPGATGAGHSLSVVPLAADLTATWPSSFLLPFLSPVLQASQGLRSPVSVHNVCRNKRQLLQLAHCHLDRHCGFHHSIWRSLDDLFMSKIPLFIDSSLFFVHFQFFILSLPWYWEDTHKFWTQREMPYVL